MHWGEKGSVVLPHSENVTVSPPYPSLLKASELRHEAQAGINSVHGVILTTKLFNPSRD